MGWLRHRTSLWGASLGTKIALGGAAVAVVLIAAFVPFAQSFDSDKRAERAEDRARAAGASAARVLAYVIDLQTGTRGFIITGEDRFLEPQQRARRALPSELERILRLVQSERRMAPLARSATRNTRSYMRFNSMLVSVARRDRTDASRIVASGAGKRRVDSLRSQFAGLGRRLDAAAKRLRAEELSAERRAFIFGIGGLAGSLLLVAVFARYLRRSIGTPIRHLTEGAGRLSRGDLSARVAAEGPREFAELADSFNDMAASIQSARGKLEGANQELQEARHEADRANAAKSEFLSRMSHELRTPLNSVIGFAQLLEMDGLDDSHQESVKRILKGGRHLLELINEVLDLSRIESGTLDVSLEPVDASAAVAEAVDLVRPLASERSIELDTSSLDGRSLYVTADQQRLKQVLLNLLSNAIKYNRHGGKTTLSLESDGERVRIAVRDTGKGMSPEEMEKLFIPFQRLAAAGSDVEGTGLGLALSKRLVETMNGRLSVESDPNVGSTFIVELPLDSPQRPAQESLESVQQIVTARTGPARSTVLYVEDNLSNLRLVEQVLARRPAIRLITAMEGGLGLELAQQHRPDVVLLDLHLPDMHGKELLEALRADSRTAEIPVVVLSADATEHQVERLLGSGARAYLTKPLDVKQFLSTLDDCLRPVSPAPQVTGS